MQSEARQLKEQCHHLVDITYHYNDKYEDKIGVSKESLKT